MNRRNALGMAARTAIALAAVGAGAGRASARQTSAKSGPIVLYCDLKVDPAREAEMLAHFHQHFKPAGAKFDGFIDLKMLKIRQIMQGDALPAGVNYRFQLTYKNEELRQIWIKSKVHADLWPGIENTLADKNFHVALFDEV